jgi:hypothetical protein
MNKFLRFLLFILNMDLSGNLCKIILLNGTLSLIFRPANSIKNRFYTVIRTFLKLIFKYHPGIINKLPHEIASK